MRTVEYRDHTLKLIDQTRLPGELRVLDCRTVAEVAAAIRRMVVRGAPAIGVTAAFGLVLGAHEYAGDDPAGLLDHLGHVAETLKATRPTAVNLAWAVDGLMDVARSAAATSPAGGVEQVRAEMLAAAQELAD